MTFARDVNGSSTGETKYLQEPLGEAKAESWQLSLSLLNKEDELKTDCLKKIEEMAVMNERFGEKTQEELFHGENEAPAGEANEKMQQMRGDEVKISSWAKEKEDDEKKTYRDRSEEGWDSHLDESLKGLNWNFLDAGKVRLAADIKDGGLIFLSDMSITLTSLLSDSNYAVVSEPLISFRWTSLERIYTTDSDAYAQLRSQQIKASKIVSALHKQKLGKNWWFKFKHNNY